ncbi:MAG: DUF433 domain-containing protein [Chloroflexi bacterium]|nr:DUF433 domain-containing protein [Chloroflexota bacterium]
MAEKRVEKENERQKPNIREEIDGVKFHTLAKGITTHPLVRSGRPCIEGTTIMVTTIAGLQNFHDMDAQQIADHLWLELFMVQDALNYYADHKQYIDVCNELSSIHGELMMESHYGDWTRELLSRRDAISKDRRAAEEAGH